MAGGRELSESISLHVVCALASSDNELKMTPNGEQIDLIKLLVCLLRASAARLRRSVAPRPRPSVSSLETPGYRTSLEFRLDFQDVNKLTMVWMPGDSVCAGDQFVLKSSDVDLQQPTHALQKYDSVAHFTA